MIDPGIWTNVQVTRLTVLQRLLYIGLISNADDDGRLNGDPLYLKGVVFPHDNITPDAINEQLKAIVKQSLIVRYKVGKAAYIQHPNWSKHQYIRDRRPSTIPPPKGYTIPPTLPSTLKQQQQQQNTNQSNTTQVKPVEDAVNWEKSLQALLLCKVPPVRANWMAKKYTEGRIRAVITKAGKVEPDNPTGWIIRALENDWTV